MTAVWPTQTGLCKFGCGLQLDDYGAAAYKIATRAAIYRTLPFGPKDRKKVSKRVFLGVWQKKPLTAVIVL